jgi:hypothetical protein
VKHLLPWLVLLVVPTILFPGALPGPEVVSADDHLTVHHAFQEKAGGRVNNPHLSDPALQFSALRIAVKRSFEEGEVPLWNPDIWAGAPLLGDAQSMVGSPVTWLHIWLPEDLAQDLGVTWLLLWIGFGTAFLVRKLGATPWGAATSGAAAMTTPFMSVWLLHPHAATLVWLPWVLLGIESKKGWLTALTTAGLVAGGHPETAAHLGIIIAIWWGARSRCSAQLLWLVTGSLLAGPIWLPFVEEALRSATLASHGGNHLALPQLLDLVWPGWHGHPATETWTQTGWSWADGRIHPGFATMALFTVALIRKERLTPLFFGLWLMCIGVSIVGLPGPLNDARMASIGALLIAIACGLGVRGRWEPWAFVAVLLTGAWAGWHDQSSIPAEQHAPLPAPWVTTLSESTRDGRVIGLGWALQPNTGALAGIEDLRGYDLPVSRDTERLHMALNPRPIRPWFQINQEPPTVLLRFAGVHAILAPQARPGFSAIDNSPVHISKISNPMPRAWIATAPRHSPTADHAITNLLGDPDPMVRPTVVKLPGNWPQVGETRQVSNLKRGMNQVSFETESPDASVAVLADSWHPGWTVRVDGTPYQALQVAGIFRGVVLPPGSHFVQWDFRPWGWKWGRILWVLGIFMGLCLRWTTRINDRCKN